MDGKGCSGKIGDGRRRDSSGNEYDFCYAEFDAYTLEECIQMAKETANVIGVRFTDLSPQTQCAFHYDNTVTEAGDFACPQGFTEAFGNLGTGPIEVSSTDTFFTCYACD